MTLLGRTVTSFAARSASARGQHNRHKTQNGERLETEAMIASGEPLAVVGALTHCAGPQAMCSVLLSLFGLCSHGLHLQSLQCNWCDTAHLPGSVISSPDSCRGGSPRRTLGGRPHGVRPADAQGSGHKLAALLPRIDLLRRRTRQVFATHTLVGLNRLHPV